MRLRWIFVSLLLAATVVGISAAQQRRGTTGTAGSSSPSDRSAAPSTATAPAAAPARSEPDAPAPAAAAQPGVLPQPAAAAGADTAADEGSALLAKAGVTTCLPVIRQLSGSILAPNSRYGALTVYGRADPDKHLSGAIYGQSIPGQQSEVALGAVFSAPAPNGKCDGTALYVLPTTRSCTEVQRSILANKGELAANLGNVVPVLNNAGNANRLMLLPAAADSCVIVAMQSSFSP